MKPALPKGVRDFGPEQVIKRNYIFDTVKSVFTRYGFQPIETPTIESLSTLTGKYGEEGDKLLFKILNNGDFLLKADDEALANKNSNKLVPSISKRGLRYDLTVPFARFVVMNQNDLTFPFKRYQIQPVWRADRPAKGRYQEFYQCDVDVVGSDALIYEAELINIYDEVFRALGLSVIIRLNNRKILAGLAEVAGISDQLTNMTVAIDKLDKVGLDGVKAELAQRNISESAIEKIEAILKIKDLNELKEVLKTSESGTKGIEELEEVFSYSPPSEAANVVEFDVTLARGLDYYTGCIFEVVVDTEKHPNIKMGSIGGGGRYDDLTSVFGMKNMSGVGVSFGAERIFDVMEELSLFPSSEAAQVQVLFIAFDKASHLYAFKNSKKLREKGINTALYPEPVKLKKQMKYANDLKVPYVILVGDKEMESGNLTLKNMETGEQQSLSIEEIASVVV